MTNIAEKLRNCPKGTKLYSPLCGDCKLSFISSQGDIYVSSPTASNDICFSNDGRFYMSNGGEVVLFPSKQNRDWSTFEVSIRFKPYDKVVCRSKKDGETVWAVDFFSHYDATRGWPYVCVGAAWTECLPYNEETAKLIGTFDDYAG